MVPQIERADTPAPAPRQGLCDLRTAVLLEETLGVVLGRGSLLQRRLSGTPKFSGRSAD